jgi:hypothetical protein
LLDLAVRSDREMETGTHPLVAQCRNGTQIAGP